MPMQSIRCTTPSRPSVARALLAIAIGLAPAPAAWSLQEDAGMPTEALMALMGLSCSVLIFLAFAGFLFYALAIFLGARVAGIRASYGRSLLAAVAASGAAIPVVIALMFIAPAMSPSVQTTVLQILTAIVAVLVFRLVLKTTLGRAALTYLVGSLITTLVAVGVLVLIF